MKIITQLIQGLVIFLVDGWIVQLTWNVLVHHGMLHFPLLSYKLALILLLLTGCLFKVNTVSIREE